MLAQKSRVLSWSKFTVDGSLTDRQSRALYLAPFITSAVVFVYTYTWLHVALNLKLGGIV